ncbi:MAG: sugar phosphate nucleotidyltransferase, partial [Verrucomicrobiota bacterium]
PKQLLRLFSDESLLGETAQRVKSIVPNDHLFILTNEAQVAPTREALSNHPDVQIIGEPAKRDTAPAAALATAMAYVQDPDAIIVLLPADQLIKDVEAFQRNLSDAITRANSGKSLISIAIKPTFPATGFGYLHLGEKQPTGASGTEVFSVKRFVEKPDLETAKSYLDSGEYAWNAGMFVWRASAFLNVADQHAPELSKFIRAFPKENQEQFLTENFSQLPKISVDYAIMEKATSVEAARAEFDWDDVGAWTAIPQHMSQDEDGNTIKGTALSLDSSNNILFSTKRQIAVCGVQDLVVVEVDDAVLVCHRDHVQNIKKLLPDLPEELV